jgi:drug/metabolite transporter (DMT)-like permease
MPFWKAHAALFLVNVLYGASHVLAKGVMPSYLSPNVFILLRVLGATFLLWLLKILVNKEKIARRDLGLVAICGFFGVAANQLLFFHGLNLSSSINSGIIMTINPILVVILAYFILKEKVSWQKMTGIVLGATGAVLLTLAGNSGKGDSLLGDFFLFLNALSYAVYLVIAKPLMSKYSPLTVITYVFSFGLLYVLVFPFTIPEVLDTQFATIPLEIWSKIIFVVVGVTFLVYLLTMYGLKYLSPSTSSAYIYLQPVLVIFFALFFAYIEIAEDYSGTITWQKIAYMLMIFTGVWLTSYRFNVKK